MKNLHDVFTTLRKKGKGQYALLTGCLFFSCLLITTFCLIMYSPMVQNTLPSGGDSRKQVMMIFILAIIGCAAFSVYAAGLFFRYKSREIGIFLALGAQKSLLVRQIAKEISSLTLASCSAGLILGMPFSWLIWAIFRITLIDTPEMALAFDFRAYTLPVLFMIFVFLSLVVMFYHFMKRINILDIIQESHRAEPIRAVPHWYGWGGILLIILGGFLGYFVPSFCVLVLHWYAPSILTAPFYLPAIIGIYMVLLYTVVGGWHRGKNRYTHLIANGMMQFQGRQTIRNMLVVTVLIAGAYFASFYTPTAVVPMQESFRSRPLDYSFFYRADQSMPNAKEISKLAEKHHATITDYVEMPSASLAVDGYSQVEQKGPLGTTYTEVYEEKLNECRFFSASAWNTLTGDTLTLQEGESAATLNRYGDFYDISLVTNPITKEYLSVTTLPNPLPSDKFVDCRVLSDKDYEKITKGLPLDWQEVQVIFQAENDSYALAKELFYTIVNCSDADTAIIDSYDRIQREKAHEKGELYVFDTENSKSNQFPVIDLKKPDSSDFRMNWMYMPQFRELDKVDFASTFAVFFLLFIFVAILCFGAAAVILFTRSLTLILCNQNIYTNLQKLGASNAYLRKTAKGQISRIFFVPILTGTLLIFAFYLFILAANGGDGHIVFTEWLGIFACILVICIISALLYKLYRITIKKVWSILGINYH